MGNVVMYGIPLATYVYALVQIGKKYGAKSERKVWSVRIGASALMATMEELAVLFPAVMMHVIFWFGIFIGLIIISGGIRNVSKDER
jgi:hypothetical protein